MFVNINVNVKIRNLTLTTLLGILKIWTSILTIIGAQTAESEEVFGDTADGFRAHRTIYDSLSTLITMYEDAKLPK